VTQSILAMQMSDRASAPWKAPLSLVTSGAVAAAAIAAAAKGLAASDGKLRFVASAEELLLALSQNVRHIVITQHLDLTGRSGGNGQVPASVLTVRATRSIVVCSHVTSPTPVVCMYFWFRFRASAIQNCTAVQTTSVKS
jgi:hypothetical protein